jgi:hypothetical protein
VTRRDWMTGMAAAVIVTYGVVWASNIRVSPHSAEQALLRLAWRARPDRIEVCSTPSAEAQANLPAHMRQTQICEGTTASYRLDVRRDNRVVVDETVRGGGLRHDRPLYVFREIPLEAGAVTVAVRFTRIEPVTAEEHSGNGSRSVAGASQTPARELLQAVPVSLLLERQLHARPGAVILVTYDPDRRELLIVESPR